MNFLSTYTSLILLSLPYLGRVVVMIKKTDQDETSNNNFKRNMLNIYEENFKT